MTRKIVTTLTLCFITAGLFAQQKISLDNIRSVSLRNSGTIVESEELKGYFFYYISDKVDKKTNEYTIQIMDEDLKLAKKIVFEDSKEEQLLESSYNSNSFAFQFLNTKEKTITYKIYGLDGKLKYTYTKELNKKSLYYFTTSLKSGDLNDEAGTNKFTYNIDQKGYISVIPIRDGKEYSFEINLYMSDKKKQLTYTPDEDIKYAVASFLGSNDSIAVFEVLKKERTMSNKFMSSLLGINLTTGKKAFELTSETSKYKFYPLSASAINGNSELLIMGSYYDKDDKVVKDKSLGIAAIAIDNKGKIKGEKYNSWEREFSKYLSISAKGKIDDIGYLYFHKIIQTEGGDIYAVAEGYKKVASATGIGLTVLAAAAGSYGSTAVTQLNITDMMLIKFNKDFQIKDIAVYEKNKNKFMLPGTGSYLSPQMMAATAKIYGAYDYEFTRTDKFHTNFVVGYNDYERTKEYKGLTFNSISYNGEKLTQDKINLKSKASSLRVMPAKAGFILISEYFKKDKRLDLRMEKLN